MKFFIISVFILIGTFSVFSQTNRAEVSNPAVFKTLQVNQKIEDCRGSSVIDCGRNVLLALDMVGLGGEDNFREREESFRFNNGVNIFFFSVLATKPSFTEEWRVRIAFTKTKAGFKFVQAGMQHRCLVGRIRGKWQKNECQEQQNPIQNIKTSQREVENLDDFQFIAITGRAAGILAQPCAGNLETCGNKMFNALYKPDGFEGIPTKNIKRETFTFQSGRTTKGIYLVTLTGYEDDSVSGERIRIEFNKRGNSWIAQGGSKQFRCYRGGFANQWTKDLCP